MKSGEESVVLQRSCDGRREGCWKLGYSRGIWIDLTVEVVRPFSV